MGPNAQISPKQTLLVAAAFTISVVAALSLLGYFQNLVPPDDLNKTPEPLPEEICADGIDNDLDGFTDCNDSDCADYPACQEPPTGFVSVKGDKFFRNGEEFFPFGVNYFPSYAETLDNWGWPAHMDDSFSFDGKTETGREIILRELDKLQDAGFNVVSIGDLAKLKSCEPLNWFIGEAGKRGLVVNIALPECDPQRFCCEEGIQAIIQCGLSQNENVFAYDIAWEPNIGGYLDRFAWQNEFGKWLEEQYGSIAEAEIVLGHSLSEGHCLPGWEPAKWNSSCISHSIPSRMVAGQTYNVTVKMKNTDDVVWSKSKGFNLGAVGWGDAPKFGTDRAYLADDQPVGFGKTAEFNFSLAAPSYSGRFNVQFRMVQEGVNWFGSVCMREVEVVESPESGEAEQQAITSAAAVCPPTDQENCSTESIPFVSAYRRFVEDFWAKRYARVAERIRAADPNHPISFRSSGTESKGSCFAIPANIRSGLGAVVDFASPEGYSIDLHAPAGGRGSFERAAFFPHYYDFGKPVVWAEFGYNSCSEEFCSEPELTGQEQYKADYWRKFFEFALEGKSSGVIGWWFAGKRPFPNDSEVSDFGIVEPYSLTPKPAYGVVQEYSSIFGNSDNHLKQDPNHWVVVDNDKKAGLWSVLDDSAAEFLLAKEEGKVVGVKTICTGADSSNSPLNCAGDSRPTDNGLCPRKCLNSTIISFWIRAGNGKWVEAKYGMTIIVPENTPLFAKGVILNTNEAEWLGGGEGKAVFSCSPLLGDECLVKELPKNVGFGEKFVFEEFKFSEGISSAKTFAFQMRVSGSVWFGDTIRAKVAPPPPFTEQNCSDSLDNDQDGSIDCKDTDCADNAACKITASPPKLKYPANGTLFRSSDSCKLSWGSVDGAEKYRVHATLRYGDVLEMEASDTELDLEPFWHNLMDGRIAWSVAALDAQGNEISRSAEHYFFKFFDSDYSHAFARPKEPLFSLNPWCPDTAIPHSAYYGIKNQHILIHWSCAEPAKGMFNWDGNFDWKANGIEEPPMGCPNYDRVVEAARKNGIELDSLDLAYSPPWASKDGTEYTVRDAREFADFAREAVKRYKPGGTLAKEKGWGSSYGVWTWEIWNEPDIDFWPEKPKWESYVTLLKLSYIAIKEECPSCRVLNGGFSSFAVVGNGMLDAFYSEKGNRSIIGSRKWGECSATSEVRNCFDILAMHPYPHGQWCEDPINTTYFHDGITALAAKMDSYGDTEKNIYMNEFGYPFVYGGRVDEERQATYFLTAIALMLASSPRVREFAPFNYSSSPVAEKAYCNPCKEACGWDYWGMVDSKSWVPSKTEGGGIMVINRERLVFKAYLTMARLLSGSTFEEIVSPAEGIFGARFRMQDGRKVLMLRTESGTHEYAHGSAGADYEIHYIDGSTEKKTGPFAITVDEKPVFVVG